MRMPIRAPERIAAQDTGEYENLPKDTFLETDKEKTEAERMGFPENSETPEKQAGKADIDDNILDDGGNNINEGDSLPPNKTFTLNGIKYKTDDNGKIYSIDGKRIENNTYVLDGKVYHTNDSGERVSTDEEKRSIIDETGWSDEIDEPILDSNMTIDEEAKSEAIEGDYPSTYKERMDQTPRDGGERGEWQGERGESMFLPNDSEIKEILEEYGIDGISYEDAIPDFSPCSESTVAIDNMTDNRNGPPVEGSNFQQCDQKCAELWNEQCREGKNDWSARDVANWRRENGYSWHERNDMKTCDLIPTKINAYFGHLGGVGEYIRLPNSNLREDVFDE